MEGKKEKGRNSFLRASQIDCHTPSTTLLWAVLGWSRQKKGEGRGERRGGGKSNKAEEGRKRFACICRLCVWGGAKALQLRSGCDQFSFFFFFWSPLFQLSTTIPVIHLQKSLKFSLPLPCATRCIQTVSVEASFAWAPLPLPSTIHPSIPCMHTAHTSFEKTRYFSEEEDDAAAAVAAAAAAKPPPQSAHFLTSTYVAQMMTSQPKLLCGERERGRKGEA